MSDSTKMFDQQAMLAFMKSKEFDFLSLYDDSACHAPSISGEILHFYSPSLKRGAYFSFGNPDDTMLFEEVFRDAVKDFDDSLEVDGSPELTEFMKLQGFIRIPDAPRMDYYDEKVVCMMIRFYNPITEIGAEFCEDEIENDDMFGDDIRDDILTKYGMDELK